jgi:PAS domain S-box-containing protein
MSAPSQRAAVGPWAAEILMFAGDGIVAADEHSRILLCNHAAEEIFGYAADEVLGRPIETLFAEPHQARRQPVDGRVQGLAPEWAALVEHRRMAGQRKGGGEFPIEATLSRREIEGEMVLIAVCATPPSVRPSGCWCESCNTA